VTGHYHITALTPLQKSTHQAENYELLAFLTKLAIE
jgi:hypothetical protein